MEACSHMLVFPVRCEVMTAKKAISCRNGYLDALSALPGVGVRTRLARACVQALANRGELKMPSACFAQNLCCNASHSTHVLKSHMVAHCMARGLAKRTPALEQKVATLFPGDRGWFELITPLRPRVHPAVAAQTVFLVPQSQL